jgi:BMFP domain-containing protein YqiC
MSNTDKNIDNKIDQLEDAVQKYASKDTVVSIGGYSFTPAKLMIAATILSSLGGASWAVFEFYHDYMNMKSAIANYVSPDLSEYDKRIIILEQNSEKGLEYTREINTNLKGDIRRIEQVVDAVERTSKNAQREVEKDVNDIRRQVDGEIKEVRRGVDFAVREMQKQVDTTVQNVNERVNRIERETNTEVRAIRREVDDKIKKALDNPLAN